VKYTLHPVKTDRCIIIMIYMSELTFLILSMMKQYLLLQIMYIHIILYFLYTDIINCM